MRKRIWASGDKTQSSCIHNGCRAESDIDVRAILVDTLVDLLDLDLYDYLHDSLKTDFIEQTVFNLHDLDQMYADQDPSRGDGKDPMYIFEPQYKDTFAYFSSSG